MAKVWKLLALLLVITALVWLTTLWRWQSAQLDPSASQLIVHLIVLPLAFTTVLVTLVFGVTRLRRYAAAPAAPAAKAGASPAHAPPPSTAPPPAPRPVPIRVLAAAVQLRAGDNWNDARSSIAEGRCKADLDPHMKDDDGIAVFTAPVDDVATDSVADALDGIVASRMQLPADWAGGAAQPELLRALTLLEAAATAMLDAVESQWPALSVAPPSSRNAGNPPALPPVVAIRIGVPARWPAAAQQLSVAWLQQLFEPHLAAGLQAAGPSRGMANTARPAVQLHVHPVDSAESYWLLMEQQLQQWQRERQPGLLWALAADSLVGDASVDALSGAGELFSGRKQQGVVPGEAAAGLLLASTHWISPADSAPVMAVLHPASVSRRDKSADVRGRTTPEALLQALADTLQGTGLPADRIEHLTTDADHRASRTAEVYETVQALLPHLDSSEHLLRLGLGCGDTGVARLLACAALTALQVQSSDAPALLLGTHGPFDRLAVLITPATPTAEARPAAMPQAA